MQIVPNDKGNMVEMIFYNEQTLLNCDKYDKIEMDEYQACSIVKERDENQENSDSEYEEDEEEAEQPEKEEEIAEEEEEEPEKQIEQKQENSKEE